MTAALLAGARSLQARLHSALRRRTYRIGRARRVLLAAVFRRRAARLVRAFLAQDTTVDTREVNTLISTLADAFGAGRELAESLHAVAEEAKHSRRWRPNDPMSIEELTKHAEAELRAWMDEHPGEDPRDDGTISDIAESYVPIYHADRLRVALESSLALVAGDVEDEASSPAELLGIAMREWITDALYEIAEAAFAEDDAPTPHVR